MNDKEKEVLMQEAQNLVETLESMKITDAAALLAFTLRHTRYGATINKLINVLVESEYFDAQLGTLHQKSLKITQK